MNTEHEAWRAGSTVVLQRIQGLAEWARCANTYMDEHNAPPPHDVDDVTREELVASIEELGGLVQRYADSLRGFADRESFVECSVARTDDASMPRLGTLLQFPTRSRSVPVPASCDTDQMAYPNA